MEKNLTVNYLLYFYYLRQGGGYAIRPICQSVCLSIGPTNWKKQFLVEIRSWILIPDHFSKCLAIVE